MNRLIERLSKSVAAFFVMAGVGVGHVYAQCDATFEEYHGVVVVEVESVAPASGWTEETTVDGYTGDSYYRWNGGDKFNSPGSGLLEYKVKINNPGTYRFQWRSKVGHGSNSTESNDSWLKMPDADFFYAKKGDDVIRPKGVCTNDCPEGSGANGWFKAYLGFAEKVSKPIYNISISVQYLL